ncbi:putative 1,3-beta glucanase [Aspergillus affinis]|uniref:putative 1,3-beta glucanase n=1 Tax=Aspergillus affinis TaxID=1070780 RepID=UPI0022FE8AB9|nr:uncharacterized protein KD926_003338 [Aspergillus affinis]KAI9043568.1 hypothetical protein KD926_003338 [Aspergillus affinis]
MRSIVSLLLFLIVQTSITLISTHWWKTSGNPKFDGFPLYGFKWDEYLLSSVSTACVTAMTRLVDCHEQTYMLIDLRWRAGLQNDALSDLVCVKTCGKSIQAWFEAVSLDCADYKEENVLLTKPGGILWAGWNETCLKDPDTGQYCGGKSALHVKSKGSSEVALTGLSTDVIDDFTVVKTIDEMPTAELCSHCFVKRYEMMQSTSYSIYDKTY